MDGKQKKGVTLLITRGYLTTAIRKICIWKGQNPPAGIIELIHPQFERFEERDLDGAIETLQNDEERFTPSRLKRALDNIVFARQTRDWEETKIREARESEKFWAQDQESGECKREACRGCERLDRGCRVRAAQWIKGLKWVMRGGPGEGRARAEEIIRHMTREFMGGI